METNQNVGSSGSAQSSNPNSSTATKNIPMGVLAYLGPLLVISFLTAKDDPFVKFHIKQGLVLLVIEIAIWMIGMIGISYIWTILTLLNLATFVLAVIGIINVINGKEKELPIVGKYSSYFKF